MRFVSIVTFGLLSLSVVTAGPNLTGPEDSRITPPPENFNINHEYKDLRGGPSITVNFPIGRPLGSTFGPAANSDDLQTFYYNSVVNREGFDNLYRLAGHLLPENTTAYRLQLLSFCVMDDVSLIL